MCSQIIKRLHAMTYFYDAFIVHVLNQISNLQMTKNILEMLIKKIEMNVMGKKTFESVKINQEKKNKNKDQDKLK